MSQVTPTTSPSFIVRSSNSRCDQQGAASTVSATFSSSGLERRRIRPTKLLRSNGPWVAENLASKPYYTRPEKDELPEDHPWRQDDHEGLVAVHEWFDHGPPKIFMRKFYRDGPDDDGIIIRDDVHDESTRGNVVVGYGLDEELEEVEMKLWKRDVLLRKQTEGVKWR